LVQKNEIGDLQDLASFYYLWYSWRNVIFHVFWH